MILISMKISLNELAVGAIVYAEYELDLEDAFDDRKLYFDTTANTDVVSNMVISGRTRKQITLNTRDGTGDVCQRSSSSKHLRHRVYKSTKLYLPNIPRNRGCSSL